MKNIGKKAYEYYMKNDVTKREASRMFGGETLVKDYMKYNDVPDRPRICKGSKAYELYMSTDMTSRAASEKFGSPTLLDTYIKYNNLPKKDSPTVRQKRKSENSVSAKAYEYYMNNNVSKRGASLLFGNQVLVYQYMCIHNLPDKDDTPYKCRGALAYEYYMNSSVSKKDASLKFGNPQLVIKHMIKYNLPDRKDTKYKLKGEMAYQEYMSSDMSAIAIAKKYKMNFYMWMKKYGKPSKERTSGAIAYSIYMNSNKSMYESCKGVCSTSNLTKYMLRNNLPKRQK